MSLAPNGFTCVSRLTITGSDNGLSPGWRQAIIWTNAGILLIEPLGTNFSENSIEILTFSFTKMRLKVSSAKWRPFCLGLNVLKHICVCINKVAVGPANRFSPAPENYHYGDVIIGTIASQITSLTIVYSTIYSDADQRKHQSFASLAFVRGIHRGPVNSPHKWSVTRKMFPFDDVIMMSTLI